MDLTSSLPPPISSLPKGYGKIIRDDAGNVLRIELAEGEQERGDDREMDMEELEPEVDGKVLGKWVTELGGGERGQGVGGDGNVVRGESDLPFVCPFSNFAMHSMSIRCPFDWITAMSATFFNSSVILSVSGVRLRAPLTSESIIYRGKVIWLLAA
jgi:hypothetical protein